MKNLGRMEDLPEDYRAELTRQNLVPLWPSLLALLPEGTPSPKTAMIAWAYKDLRPLLIRAGELTPIEKAERRVLVLSNPGHGQGSVQVTSSMYLGMQLLLPGEWAPSHRHTPNAVRMVVEGEGAFTTVDGEVCEMRRGDLILTPRGLWHEHTHTGTGPVVWLDVLDVPLVYFLESSYHVGGERQLPNTRHGNKSYVRGGLVPTHHFVRSDKEYPMLRYPWADTQAALQELARDQPDLETVQLTYVNPETGDDAFSTLGFYALMLRPGQTLRLPVRSPAAVYHVIEGEISIAGDDQEQARELSPADTCCVPGYAKTVLRNRSERSAAFVFIADEAPLQQRLGLYEVRS